VLKIRHFAKPQNVVSNPVDHPFKIDQFVCGV
jgi:hypothetical protein